MRGTSISGALAFAAPLFDANGYAGLRRAIDVSGDGANNSGAPLVPVRDAVVAAGIVINGLPVLIAPSLERAVGGPDLAVYYRDCVIGGPGAFVLPARRFASPRRPRPPPLAAAGRGSLRTRQRAGRRTGAPLRERGITLSESQIYRIVGQEPDRISFKVLVALCDIFGIEAGEIGRAHV